MIDEVKREHLRRIGRLGGLARTGRKAAAARANCARAGRSRSEAKTRAARENGRRGGRPVRLKSLSEIIAIEGAKFRKAHPEIFGV